MKKYIAIVLAFLIGAFVIAGCRISASPAGEKPLRVGMDASYPPFGSQNVETKAYEGFDVDIIKAIGEEEKFPVEIVNLNFDGLIPALQTKDLDIVINDMGITPDRSQKVLFSKPYYYAGLGIVVQAGNTSIHDKKDLAGKRVGVSIASTGEEAARKIEGAQVKTYNTITDAFLDLKNGGLDAVVNDVPVNEFYIAKSGEGKIQTVDTAFDVEPLGIAVAKNNKELMDKIDKGLAAIKQNGTYAQIYQKWFGKEPPAEFLK